MSHLFATAGAQLFIGPAKTFAGIDLTASDFTDGSPVFTEIQGTTNLGTFGDTSELITSNQIAVARTRKLKGTRNAGSMQVVCDLDYADPGQLAAIAAEKTNDTYAFKLQFKDAPSGGTPSIRYFTALVMSASEQLDEANNSMKLNLTLEVDSNIVRVPASAGGEAPDNSVLPTITGTATEGQTLTAAPGTWSGDPAPTYAYQWFASGESLAGATGTTLALAEAHVGKTITVLVTATNAAGSSSAFSAATSEVDAAE